MRKERRKQEKVKGGNTGGGKMERGQEEGNKKRTVRNVKGKDGKKPA